MRVLSWNLNHRAAKRRIPDWLSHAIAAHAPDVMVLTEYVEGTDHDQFVKALHGVGLRYNSISHPVPRQNQVLIATRLPHRIGHLSPPTIHPAVPSNALHVVLDEPELDLIGFRMPAFVEGRRRLKRETWEWLLQAAASLSHVPAVITGDLNTAPQDSVADCGDCLKQLMRIGWHHARPTTGFSWVHPRWGTERQIDHTFVSPLLSVIHAHYSWTFRDEAPATQPKVGHPDHAMLIVDIRGS